MTHHQSAIVLFKEQKIRRIWQDEEWWFSVVDIVGALTDSPNAGAYWRKLKQRLKEEESEVVTFCHGLKLVTVQGIKALLSAGRDSIPSSLRRATEIL